MQNNNLTVNGVNDKFWTPSQHIEQDQEIAKFGHDFSVGQINLDDTTKKIITPTGDVLQKQSFTASKKLEENQVSFPLPEEIQSGAQNVEECVEDFFSDLPAENFRYDEEEKLETQGSEKIAENSEKIAEGSEIIAEGSEIIAEGSEIIAEGSEIIAENSKIKETGKEKESSASKEIKEIKDLQYDSFISLFIERQIYYEVFKENEIKQIISTQVAQKTADPNKINDKGQVALTSEDVADINRDVLAMVAAANILYKLLVDGNRVPLTELEIKELEEALTASLIEKLASKGLLLPSTHSEKPEKIDKQYTAEVSKLNNLPIQSLDRAQRKSTDQAFKATAVLVLAQTRSLISDIGMINRRNEERAKEEKEAARAEEHYWIIKKDIMQTEDRREQRIEGYKKSDILASEVSKCSRQVIQKVRANHSVHTSLKGTDTTVAAA